LHIVQKESYMTVMTRQEAFQDTQERIIEAMVAHHNISEAQAIRYLTMYVATAVDLVNGK
jgi:hypothetical protein